MTAEQENAAAGDERPKRTWNSSTRLTQPRRTTARSRGRQTENAAGQGQTERTRTAGQARTPRPTRNNDHQRGGEHANENENEQRTLTRELLERAVSTAFGGLLQDSTLDVSAFPDYYESQSSELSSVRDKENTPPLESPTKMEVKLRSALEGGTALSASHRQRRREHAEALQQATEDIQSAREFQRRMKHAAFEHRERKMAVQALQARIQREIQFLAATAAGLEKREFLLDDAFESYEHALRFELGLVDSARSLSKKKQAEVSPRRSY